MKRVSVLLALCLAAGLFGPQAAAAQSLLRRPAGRDEAARPIMLAQLRGPQAGQAPAPGGRAGPPPARGGPDSAPPPPPPPAKFLTLNQVSDILKKRTPGRLLDSDPPDPRSAKPVFRVRWQADSGQRIDFVVDAVSGGVISQSGG